VLREIRRLLPREPLFYFADQAHVPYGHRPPEEVRRFCEGISRFLVAEGAKLVVVACNTGSSAALHHLRQVLPAVPFVGMEPAVKPAALQSRTRTIGVLATPGTFRGTLFGNLVDRFARGVRVLTRTCPGLVEAVEEGEISGPRVRRLLEDALRPLLGEGIDTLVLACTHYPLALAAVREVCGPGVDVVDPSAAVARQVARVLESRGQLAPGPGAGPLTVFTTGSPGPLLQLLPTLLGEEAEVRKVSWDPPAHGLCETRRSASAI